MWQFSTEIFFDRSGSDGGSDTDHRGAGFPAPAGMGCPAGSGNEKTSPCFH